MHWQGEHCGVPLSEQINVRLEPKLRNKLVFFSFFHFNYRNTLSDYAVVGLTP